MPIGVFTNCGAVLLGGLLGIFLGKVLPETLKEHLPTMFGLCSIAIGVNSVIKASGMTAVVLAILVGFTIGHLLHLEFWTSRFFHKLVHVMHLGGDDIDMEFYITAGVLTPTMFADLSACGGILTMAAGFRVSRIKSVPLVDLMPALILVMPFSLLWSNLMQ